MQQKIDWEKIDPVLIEKYIQTKPKVLAAQFGVNLSTLRARALGLGLRKKPYMAKKQTRHEERVIPGNIKAEFGFYSQGFTGALGSFSVVQLSTKERGRDNG